MELRKATLKDCKFIYDLRYSPDIRKISSNPNKNPYKIYKEFFGKHYKEFRIIGNNKGYLRKNDDGYISICLIKSARDKGNGKKLLKKLDGRAIVFLNNPRSLHCFTKANWKLKGFYFEK